MFDFSFLSPLSAILTVLAVAVLFAKLNSLRRLAIAFVFLVAFATSVAADIYTSPAAMNAVARLIGGS